MKLDLANLRYRAASKMSLCFGHHEMHRSDDGHTMWVTCDDTELDRLALPDASTREDFSRDIQFFMMTTMANHEQDVVGSVVTELLNRVEAVGGFESVYNRCEHGYMPLCPVSDHGITRP